ncbi:MAG: hypothetical protein KDA86_18940 [Planctomycetaceae bacterium]|nr:hypothetical protein [Planctomycetaceae bacterium]
MDRDRAQNRSLFYDQQCGLILLTFFNPSLHDLKGASALQRVRRKLGCRETSLGSLSDAMRVFDADRLMEIVQELLGRITKEILSRFLRDREVRAGKRVPADPGTLRLKVDEWWLADIATMHRWRRVGWIRARKLDEPRSRWALYAHADELDRLRRLRDARHQHPYPAELVTSKSADP